MTGRVLSIRDHAIEAPLPAFRASLDRTSLHNGVPGAPENALTPEQSRMIEPFRRMIELRRLSGRILESVYVRRNRPEHDVAGVQHSDNSGNVNTSLQQICAQADAIGLELAAWEQRLGSSFSFPAAEVTQSSQVPYNGAGVIWEQYRSELRIESCLLQLLLYRPSPVFMVPSTHMAMTCGRAAKTAIGEWQTLEEQQRMKGAGAGVCKSARQLHGLLSAGLAALYCDW